jgi:hypothetical protein
LGKAVLADEKIERFGNNVGANPLVPSMKIRVIPMGLLCCLFALKAPLRGELHYKGSVVDSGQTLIMISSSNGFNKWCMLGDSVEGCKIRGISPDGNQLTVENTAGKRSTLLLEKAKVKMVVGDDGLIPLDQLNWKWIKSQDNPMRKMPETLPTWAYSNWATLSNEIKTDLLNYYRAHGWDVEVNEKAEGRVHVRNTRLRDPSERQPTFEELKAQGALVPATGNMLVKPKAHEEKN